VPQFLTRVLALDVTRRLSKEQQIIIGHLTYFTSKLWNTDNCAIVSEEIELSLSKLLHNNSSPLGDWEDQTWVR